jgi:hypothetical protein
VKRNLGVGKNVYVKKQELKMWIGFIYPRIGFNDSCGNTNQP